MPMGMSWHIIEYVFAGILTYTQGAVCILDVNEPMSWVIIHGQNAEIMSQLHDYLLLKVNYLRLNYLPDTRVERRKGGGGGLPVYSALKGTFVRSIVRRPLLSALLFLWMLFGQE